MQLSQVIPPIVSYPDALASDNVCNSSSAPHIPQAVMQQMGELEGLHLRASFMLG